MNKTERDIILWLNKLEARMVADGLRLKIVGCRDQTCQECEIAGRIITYLQQEIERGR